LSPFLWGAYYRGRFFAQDSERLGEVLQMVYGKNFLCPGGPKAVDSLFKGVAIAGKNVVDIGSALCGAAQQVASKQPRHIFCFDMNTHFISAAKKNIAEWGMEDTISVEKVSFDKIPLGNESVDLVYAREFLVQLPFWLKGALCLEVYRILKPGGLFIITDWVSLKRDHENVLLSALSDTETLHMHYTSLDKYIELLTVARFQLLELREITEEYLRGISEAHEKILSEVGDEIVHKFGKPVKMHCEALCQKYKKVISNNEIGMYYYRLQKPLHKNH